MSLDIWVSDLETVVEATGLKRFPLFGMSQGCAVAVAYAARHPERVSHLILLGGYVFGSSKRAPENAERLKALMTLVRMDWGSDSSALRQLFTSQLVPDATKEVIDTFNELQRRTTSPEMASRYLLATGDIDISNLVDKVTAPTLVLHAREDRQIPFEQGRLLAASISKARFVALQSRNHLLKADEPATGRLFEELEMFLAS